MAPLCPGLGRRSPPIAPPGFVRDLTVKGLSQTGLARRIDVPRETVRHWGQGKRCPPGAARSVAGARQSIRDRAARIDVRDRGANVPAFGALTGRLPCFALSILPALPRPRNARSACPPDRGRGRLEQRPETRPDPPPRRDGHGRTIPHHISGRSPATRKCSVVIDALTGTAAASTGRQALSSIVEPPCNRRGSILRPLVKALRTKGPIEESRNPDRPPPPRRSAGSARGYRTNDGSLDTDRLERGKREELIRPNCDSPQ